MNLYAIQDVSASIMNMMLTAQAMGLGTVWVGAFNELEVFEILDPPPPISVRSQSSLSVSRQRFHRPPAG